MQINVSGHHVDVSDALRKYVNEKLARLERHFDHVSNVHVVLASENKTKKAEASVNVAGGRQLFADAKNEDMYAAIDALADKLDRQIIKHKEKLTNHHRGEARRVQS